MLQIRKCGPSDQAAMRAICAVCDDPLKPERLKWVLPMYLDYYVENCADSCFVAADASDTAVGYVLSAPDQRAYRRSFVRSGKLSEVFRFSPAMGFMWLMQPLSEARFHAFPYTAHLHIDILPGCRRAGLGHRLMDALLSELRRRNVPGVMLGCAAKNMLGRGFYEKYGFTRLGTGPGTIFYGMDLRSKRDA